MPIGPITGIDAIRPLIESGGAQSATGGGEAFSAQLMGMVDEAQRLSGESNSLTIAALTGDLTDLHAATIASSRASLTLEVMVAMRNKGVDVFTEIMRMQA